MLVKQTYITRGVRNCTHKEENDLLKKRELKQMIYICITLALCLIIRECKILILKNELRCEKNYSGELLNRLNEITGEVM